MTELLELALDLVCGAAEFIWAWRFYLCLMCSLAVAGGICWLVGDDTVQVILSIPVVAAGVIAGLVWEHRATGFR
jgi:hypothetical protein